jgi:hypothetical protein
MTTGVRLGKGKQQAAPVRPDGPGRIAPGQRVTCLPGSLPARDGGRGGGVLVSVGPKTSLVDVYGGRQRRIPNELLHPEAGCFVAAERDARGLRTANASGRGWLPVWSWLGWTIAEHLEYLRGERRIPSPPPAPQRLVIVNGVRAGSRRGPSTDPMHLSWLARLLGRRRALLDSAI